MDSSEEMAEGLSQGDIAENLDPFDQVDEAADPNPKNEDVDEDEDEDVNEDVDEDVDVNEDEDVNEDVDEDVDEDEDVNEDVDEDVDVNEDVDEEPHGTNTEDSNSKTPPEALDEPATPHEITTKVSYDTSESVDTGEKTDGVVEEDNQKDRVPEDLYYEYDQLCSRPFTTPGSNIPPNLLQLSHSFGYDCRRRANLQLLDERTLTFVAGNVLVLLDIHTKEQRYIRSCSGVGIGTVMPHPSRRLFAVAENGEQPSIIVYEYPSLRPYRVLRGGTAHAYSCVDFNREGTLLASVGSSPDYMLTLWDWKHEQAVLRCKAFSQDVYRVTFSPDNPGQLTTSGSGHIKFWKMANTFTGLKLQGVLGRFGKTALTDIEGYVELPDGKVVSGSEWGNMLLWDGGLIKVEICRKEGRSCHAGPIQQFALDEGELMSVGADGAVRCWDFESIDTADCADDSGLFELEPMNELLISRNVSLSSMVRSSAPDSTIWYAQDSNGGIWNLDLSFSNITQDPECLFSFHAGAIEGMDVSDRSDLMATTALDRSVRIFDFLSKKELTVSFFKQGGTCLTWAPRVVDNGEGLLAVGFEDGVVRLLELYNPKRMRLVAGRNRAEDAELRLKQAFKPHNAPVKAISYDPSGQILATGSADCTVFFFAVGGRYEPIGFVTVPGLVQVLQWTPPSRERNNLLVTCQSGHVVEIQAPGAAAVDSGSTYQIQNLPIRHFCFRSIKSRIKRDAEISRRQAIKEKKKQEREAKLQKLKEQSEPADEETQEGREEEEEEEEEEEKLPPIFIPDPPSPLHVAFYSSQPGCFWLSVGGYDSGYLYHCKFSESSVPSERRDEPCAHIPIEHTDHNPVITVCFSSVRKLMLCGMQDGSIRAYPLKSEDPQPGTMQDYFVLDAHDNRDGGVQHLRVSHDAGFVLSAGADGNIFSFKLPEPGALEEASRAARVPSPRYDLETEPAARDIEDPAAYSIETAKQKLESDRTLREAELRKQERRRTLAGLRSRFQEVLQQNEKLPEQVRLRRTELELDHRFQEYAERLTTEKVEEVRKELAWEEERHRIGLRKLQERCWDAVVCDTLTVAAIESDHNVSTYRLQARSRRFPRLKEQSPAPGSSSGAQGPSQGHEVKEVPAGQAGLPSPAVPQPRLAQTKGGKLASRQAEKLRKAAERAERARAKMETRKREWAELLAAKPSEDCEDQEDVRAIQLARDNVGDFKLKTAKDFTVPEHLRINVEKKAAQLVQLEEQMFQKKSDMNARVLALRDSKSTLVTHMRSTRRQLLTLREHLPPEQRRPVPAVPTLAPEETPETKLQYDRLTLQRYASAQRVEPPDPLGVVRQESEEGTMDGGDGSETGTHTPSVLSELERELLEVEKIRSLHLQDTLLKQMDETVRRFDAELRLLRHDKRVLDVHLKLADLKHATLFEELVLLKEFEKRESSLTERLDTHRLEEREIKLKLEEFKQQLEVRRREISRLEDREKALAANFHASLGENNKMADFLTRVFKKKIKRVKKNESTEAEVEAENSEEDSDEESDWEDEEEDEGSDNGAGALDDTVCPPNCDPELFENTVRLREYRLDLEELLTEEKKSAENLKKECDALTKKEKIVQCSLKAAEGDLELFNREKQQKINELDVVVPLRLHQIEYLNNGSVPRQMGVALVLTAVTLNRLRERIKELQREKSQQRELYRQARQQHVQLSNDLASMEVKIQDLEERCEQLMLMKFGKLVDLESLQTLSGSRTLEEMRHEGQIREGEHARELKVWQERVAAAKLEVTGVTREHTERLLGLTHLLTEEKLLEEKLNTRQMNMGSRISSRQHTGGDDHQKLQQLVHSQAAKIESLRQEIDKLSHKGGHVEPPRAPLPYLPPRPTLEPRRRTHTRYSLAHRRNTHTL